MATAGRSVHKATVLAALHAAGYEATTGSGGFFVRGRGFVTLAAARRLVGITEHPTRPGRRMLAGGDWGMVAALNGVRE